MLKNNPVLYGVSTLGCSGKALQVGGPESLYDPAFLIFSYKVNAPLSKTVKPRSLAASYPELFNLQASALFIEMDSNFCIVLHLALQQTSQFSLFSINILL